MQPPAVATSHTSAAWFRWFLLISLCLLGCDQGTKRWLESRLTKYHDPSDSTNYLGTSLEISKLSLQDTNCQLRLTYVRNHGSAFGRLSGLRAAPRKALLWLVFLVSLAAWWWFYRSEPEANPDAKGAYLLLLAGLLGNGIDRAVSGYVIDFIHVSCRTAASRQQSPAFNLADLYICLALGYLIARPLVAGCLDEFKRRFRPSA